MSKNGHASGDKKAVIEEILKKDPDGRPSTIAKLAKSSVTYVNRVKRQLNCVNPTHKLTKSRHTMRLALDIGAMDTEVKLLNSSRVVGTVEFTETGISYKKANAKKPSGRKLTWATLEKLMALGIE